MTYDAYKARSPDDERREEWPPCEWKETPEGGAYCKHCGAVNEEPCKLGAPS